MITDFIEGVTLARRASDQIPIFDIMNRPFVFPPFSPAPRSLESL